MNQENENYRLGTLPERYPLATALTPMQSSAEPAYDSETALMRGTLFPGLDLPFMNVVNTDLPDTPIKELMAIDFVCKELALYLDTHRNDQEAFDLYQSVLALGQEAQRRYVQKCGPITHADLLGMESYRWLDRPWPWDLGGKES